MHLQFGKLNAMRPLRIQSSVASHLHVTLSHVYTVSMVSHFHAIRPGLWHNFGLGHCTLSERRMADWRGGVTNVFAGCKSTDGV